MLSCKWQPCLSWFGFIPSKWKQTMGILKMPSFYLDSVTMEMLLFPFLCGYKISWVLQECTLILLHNNLFVSEAFYHWILPCFICHEILINFVGRKNCFFFLWKIFYFSICFTSNKLYWIEDQLTDVSTRFYTSVSWRWRVELSATWLDTYFATVTITLIIFLSEDWNICH